MTARTKYLPAGEVEPLNAELIAYRDALRAVQGAWDRVAEERQRLLTVWQPKLEALREQDEAARERAEERDEEYVEDPELEKLETLLDDLDVLDPDDADVGAVEAVLALISGD